MRLQCGSVDKTLKGQCEVFEVGLYEVFIDSELPTVNGRQHAPSLESSRCISAGC